MYLGLGFDSRRIMGHASSCRKRMALSSLSFGLSLVLAVVCLSCEAQVAQDDEYTLAYVNASYVDPATKRPATVTEEVGKYSRGRVDDAAGVVVHVHTRNGTSFYGCELPFENAPAAVAARLAAAAAQGQSSAATNSVHKQTASLAATATEPWIALIRRGDCPFEKKIKNAVLSNASAVVVYDDRVGPTQMMRQRVLDIVAIFVPKEKGETLGALADNGTRIWLQITVGTHQAVRYTNINRTSVLFVSVSFIILMIISLAWLIFYYVQRFRFINAKDQLAKRLCSAAKKALTKIPVRTLKESDLGNSECCAVCIEAYKVLEVVRILPCKHQFHKCCVDPWLLEQRTCPMCKMDILKYYGLVFTGSQESILQIEIDDNISGGGGGLVDSMASPPPLPASNNHNSPSGADRSRLVVSLPPVGFEVISVPCRAPEVDGDASSSSSTAVAIAIGTSSKPVKCQCRCMVEQTNSAIAEEVEAAAAAIDEVITAHDDNDVRRTERDDQTKMTGSSSSTADLLHVNVT